MGLGVKMHSAAVIAAGVTLRLLAGIISYLETQGCASRVHRRVELRAGHGRAGSRRDQDYGPVENARGAPRMKL
jgi:hypothetical protein